MFPRLLEMCFLQAVTVWATTFAHGARVFWDLPKFGFDCSGPDSLDNIKETRSPNKLLQCKISVAIYSLLFRVQEGNLGPPCSL